MTTNSIYTITSVTSSIKLLNKYQKQRPHRCCYLTSNSHCNIMGKNQHMCSEFLLYYLCATTMIYDTSHPSLKLWKREKGVIHKLWYTAKHIIDAHCTHLVGKIRNVFNQIILRVKTELHSMWKRVTWSHTQKQDFRTYYTRGYTSNLLNSRPRIDIQNVPGISPRAKYKPFHDQNSCRTGGTNAICYVYLIASYSIKHA